MILLVNFGGPRHLDEIAPFLTELLTDRDVIRTDLPRWLHRWFFGRIARKRAAQIREDYESIGGRSPIYFDTEAMAQCLGAIAFHRYLPETHQKSIQAIEQSEAKQICVLPLFPQFSFATTGSIARFFSERLTPHALNKLQWVQSYAENPLFLNCYEKKIRDFLAEKEIREEDVALLFSAHGLPQEFIDAGDRYQSECNQSFRALSQAFPKAVSWLSFQSKFGRGKWIKPYTEETCQTAQSWVQGRKLVVVVPISFTSDHIETLFEIEKLYLPILQAQQLTAYRCPALNLEPYWIESLSEIGKTATASTSSLVRR